MRKTVLPFLFAALALPLLAATARAERIYLRDGETLDGWIIEEKPDRVVLQVIQGTSVGKITIAPADIARIDRTRRESLEDALARAQEQARAAAPPAAPPPPGSPPPAAPAPPGAAPRDAAAGKAPPKKTAADYVPKATPEQEAQILALVDKLGQEGHHRGRAGRENNALEALSGMGPVVIPYITKTLSDEDMYRRWRAAKILVNIAHLEPHIEAYLPDTIPALLNLLTDQGTSEARRSDRVEVVAPGESQYVRATAAETLDAIAGAGIVWPTPTEGASDISPEEVAAAQKWQEWWAATKKKLAAEK